MEYRQLGNSGLKVSALAMGTMTIGGAGGFSKVGNVGLAEARRMIDIAVEAGVNLIDTANVYSAGASEETSAKRSAASARAACCSRPRRAFRWARVPTIAACRAGI